MNETLDSRPGRPDYTIRSVQNALRILKAFKGGPPSLTLSEISAKTDMTKSSTLRILYTLSKEGFVTYEEDKKRYSLGLEIFELGTQVLNSLNWRKVATKELKILSNETGLICYLATREWDKLVMVEKIFPQAIPAWAQLMLQPGGTCELYCTGIGRLLLSQLSLEELHAYLDRTALRRVTTTTTTSKEELLEIIRMVGEQNISFNRGENDDYMASICCPIFDHNGNMIAGISVCGLEEILYGSNREALIERIKRASLLISRKLGYSGPEYFR